MQELFRTERKIKDRKNSFNNSFTKQILKEIICENNDPLKAHLQSKSSSI
jgi:hypothetical protein